MKTKIIIIFLLINSCSTNKKTYTINESLYEVNKGYISPYFIINFLSNKIMESADVDETVIPALYKTQDKVNSVLDNNSKYYDFFTVKKGEKIEFIIETNNENSIDCYIGMKKGSETICIEKYNETFKIRAPLYKIENYFKNTPFISIKLDDGGSHLYYIVAYLKNNKVIVEGFSLTGKPPK